MPTTKKQVSPLTWMLIAGGVLVAVITLLVFYNQQPGTSSTDLSTRDVLCPDLRNVYDAPPIRGSGTATDSRNAYLMAITNAKQQATCSAGIGNSPEARAFTELTCRKGCSSTIEDVSCQPVFQKSNRYCTPLRQACNYDPRQRSFTCNVTCTNIQCSCTKACFPGSTPSPSPSSSPLPPGAPPEPTPSTVFPGGGFF